MSQLKSTRSNGRVRIQDMNTEPTRTQQNTKDECDVNKIIAKYKKTGILTHVTRANGSYIDVSAIPDYHTALQSVIDAKTAFAQLPSKLRNRFGNDPAQMLAFLADPKNLDESIKLGLVNKPVPTPSQQTQTSQQPTQTQQPNTTTQTQQTNTTTQTQPTQTLNQTQT